MGLPDHTFADVDLLNKALQTFLQGTVWKNYDLITTKWPSDFDCSSNAKPGSLRRHLLALPNISGELDFGDIRSAAQQRWNSARDFQLYLVSQQCNHSPYSRNPIGLYLHSLKRPRGWKARGLHD